MPSPFVFKITANEPPKLTLEAASPSTYFSHTLVTQTPDLEEAMQLELDLFPLSDGEEINWSPGAHIRVINIAPEPCAVQPAPEGGHTPHEGDSYRPPTTTTLKAVS